MITNEETPAANQDWDAAWDSDEGGGTTFEAKASGTRSRHSVEEERQNSEVSAAAKADAQGTPDDDTADAWGWGDDEDEIPDADVEKPEASSSQPPPPTHSVTPKPSIAPEVREVTMTEKYWTSSLPQPILKIVEQIYNDGANLLRPEYGYLLIV